MELFVGSPTDSSVTSVSKEIIDWDQGMESEMSACSMSIRLSRNNTMPLVTYNKSKKKKNADLEELKFTPHGICKFVEPVEPNVQVYLTPECLFVDLQVKLQLTSQDGLWANETPWRCSTIVLRWNDIWD